MNKIQRPVAAGLAQDLGFRANAMGAPIVLAVLLKIMNAGNV
jgi:hypothetical protein